MSDQNGFFRFVWRFNALALAIVLLISAGVAAFSFISSWLRPSYDAPVGHYSPVPKTAEADATYRLEEGAYGIGAYTFVAGDQRERVLALRRWKGSPASFGLANQLVMAKRVYGPVPMDAVNLLVLNTETGKSHWLFRGYARAIGAGDPIYLTDMALHVRPDNEASVGAPVGMVLQVHERDDNGDGVIDDKDHTTLYAYRTGMAEPIKLFTAELILSTNQVSADKYVVVYERGKSAISAVYATSDFHLISQQPVPNVPK